MGMEYKDKFLSALRDKLPVLVLLYALAFALALGVANLVFGDLNQDEGWYLYAAQNFARGAKPYKDYFFTQGPVMPAVYASASKLWSPFGVIGGRAFTFALGFFGAVGAGLFAAQQFPRGQRLAPWTITFALTACGVYHSYFTVIPKTYALSSLLLVLGCGALTQSHPGHSKRLAFTAGVFFALAAATRVSMGAGAVAAGIWLLVQHRRRPWQWLAFATGGVLGLLLFFGLSWHAAWDQWLFANTFHAGREGGGLMFAAGSVARLLRGYFPLCAVGVVAAFLEILNRRQSKAIEGSRQPSTTLDSNRNIILWLSVAGAIFLLQLVSPFPYDDYQVPVMPLVAAAVATVLCRHFDKLPFPKPAALCFITLMVSLYAIASPNVQSWFFIRQDRFWPVMKSEPDVVKLTRVARSIPPGTLLLTQDAYLAVAGGHRLPQGFEMGPFGYFPGLTNDVAKRQHVLNKELLKKAIVETDAPYAAFSGYAFAMQAPAMTRLPDSDRAEIFDLVAEHYDLVETVEDFGQHHTPLTLWKRKPQISKSPNP